MRTSSLGGYARVAHWSSNLHLCHCERIRRALPNSIYSMALAAYVAVGLPSGARHHIWLCAVLVCICTNRGFGGDLLRTREYVR